MSASLQSALASLARCPALSLSVRHGQVLVERPLLGEGAAADGARAVQLHVERQVARQQALRRERLGAVGAVEALEGKQGNQLGLWAGVNWISNKFRWIETNRFWQCRESLLKAPATFHTSFHVFLPFFLWRFLPSLAHA